MMPLVSVGAPGFLVLVGRQARKRATPSGKICRAIEINSLEI
jgi:hypothetical protein